MLSNIFSNRSLSNLDGLGNFRSRTNKERDWKEILSLNNPFCLIFISSFICFLRKLLFKYNKYYHKIFLKNQNKIFYKFLNRKGCLGIAKTGCGWRQLPKEYGKWYSVWKRFKRWSNKGVWDKVFEILKPELNRPLPITHSLLLFFTKFLPAVLAYYSKVRSLSCEFC